MKLRFLSICAVILQAAEAGEPAFFVRDLDATTGKQLVVTREISDWKYTPEEQQEFEAYKAKLAPGMKTRRSEFKNIYRFLLKTNAFDSGVELWLKQVGAFKEEADRSPLVVLDVLLDHTNLVVAFRERRNIVCNVVNRVSKQSLDWQSAHVFTENESAGSVAERVSLSQATTGDYLISMKLLSDTNLCLFQRSEGRWRKLDGNVSISGRASEKPEP